DAHTASMSLAVPSGEEGIESPMAGSIIDLPVKVGATVEAGATLMIISAMKMETAITVPRAGVVTAMSPAEIGSTVAAGQIVATIAPARRDAVAASPRQYGNDTWAPQLAE